MTAYKYAYTTGNLGSFQDVADYVYDDLYWGDLLSMYNGQLITYDTIGNMLSDGERTYTWRNGRELATLTKDGKTWNFTYDADCMRTSRVYGNTYYKYAYNGGQLSWMNVIGNILRFTYDASGKPVSVTYNGVLYYYVTNLQGDVVAILDSTGATVVTYTYDVWGKLLSTTDTTDENLGYYNPLRYRGYVYDNETGLYYLQSRYYNPEIGRFISADSPDYLGADGTLTSYNLFAYCGNNPVMGYDPTGTINWGNVIKAVAIVVAVTAVVALTVATAGAAAVATGAVSASVVTAATTGTVVGGLTAGASEIAIQCATKGSDNLDYMAIGIESFVGAVHGAIDGVSATTTSVTSRLACKGGKVLISAVGSMGHSINQGNGTAETLTAVGKSIGANILLQGALTWKDYYTGVLNSTMLEQNLLDGAMNYGIKQGFITGIIRGGSNVFRNQRSLIPIVF